MRFSTALMSKPSTGVLHDMTTTRAALERVTSHVDESLGIRELDLQPQLSPVSSAKDQGRRRLHDFGRIAIDQVTPDPDQPRKEFSQESIDRLAQSLRDQGQLAPILVRWSAELDKWVIVAGERRWRAAKAAGLTQIECRFDESEPSEVQIREKQMIENLQRENLRPVEEARAFASLMESRGWNGKQLAARLHVPASKVSRALSLLDLPDDVQARVQSGELGTRSAYELSRLPSTAQQSRLADTAVKHKMSTAQVRSAANQKRGARKSRSRGVKFVLPLEGGWKVTVTANRKGTYHDVEQQLVFALEEVKQRIDNGVFL